MTDPTEISIRPMVDADCAVIASAFHREGWNKPRELFERYLHERTEGKRDVLTAEFGCEAAGYVTINWGPEYPIFRERYIPEIADLNVLKKFRRHGIGTRLMNEAERIISERSDVAGIRVGLTADYGAAQRLYVKCGFIPDGHGVSQRRRFFRYGDELIVDDDLTLAFTKQLR